ncbi:MAG: flagellar hook-basal body complex protein FliE [Nitrospinota bacterium]
MRIDSLGRATGPEELSRPPRTEKGSFLAALKEKLSLVNDLQKGAERAGESLAVGESKNIHETMISLERADLALRLLTQIRNKALEAYREIMRMQV